MIFKRKINRRHIVQGRFKAILVEKDSYYHELIRYIVLNPVRAKLVRTPETWRWSSQAEVTGKAKPTGCVDIKRTQSFFDKNPKTAWLAYDNFIQEKLSNERFWDDLRGGIILGSLEFAEKIKEHIIKGHQISEAPRRERWAHRPPLRKFMVNFKNKDQRNNLVCRAFTEYGYGLSEIGRHLGLHYSSISKIVKSAKKQKS